MLSDWIKCELVERKVEGRVVGTIVSVTEFGLFVEIDGFFVDGLLHVSQLGDDYFILDKERMKLVGSRSGEEFGLGDKLEVSIVNIQAPRGRISLDLGKKGNVNMRRKKR